MALSSILAIYFLFFAFSAFLLLPFGVRTDEEVGNPRQPGHAESAPHRFSLARHLLKAAVRRGGAVRDLLRQLDAMAGSRPTTSISTTRRPLAVKL